MAWTDERVDLLKKLWADGLSASQIAGRLGGVTRNAVIGKVHRLGLSGRATTTRTKAARPRRAAARPKPQTGGGGAYMRTQGNAALKLYYETDEEQQPEAIIKPMLVQELYIPPDQRASILTLKETNCRWPIGDPTDDEFHFCGRDSLESGPYCEYHARVAYQPAQTRRRKATVVTPES